MGDGEFKKYDSADKYRQAGVRLTADASTREGEHGKMVRLSFTSESRKEQHKTLWVECNVCDFNAEAASFLLKGDILMLVEGKPCLREYEKDGETRQQFVVDRAEVVIGGALFNELKERGFTPGQKSGAKPAAKKGAKPAVKPAGKPAAKATKPAAKKPAPISIPDDDDVEIEDDEGSEE